MSAKNKRPLKRNVKKNQWGDHYTKRAQKENYAARSVYKLKEIQEKFKIIKKADRVADLGCAPGSWLRYTADLVGDKGIVVGIDKKPLKINLPQHVRTAVFDIFARDEWEPDKEIDIRFNVVLSDMAPSTTGNKRVDALKSFELCLAALEFAKMRLVPGGIFVCKIFQGGDFQEFIASVKMNFLKHKIFKPQSCRKASKEIYIIGLGKKEEEICPDIANGQQ